MAHSEGIGADWVTRESCRTHFVVNLGIISVLVKSIKIYAYLNMHFEAMQARLQNQATERLQPCTCLPVCPSKIQNTSVDLPA